MGSLIRSLVILTVICGWGLPVLRAQDGVASDANGPRSPETATVGAADTATTSPVEIKPPAGRTPTFRELAVEFFSSPLSYLLMLMVGMYFVLIVPQQRANRRMQREQAELLGKLKKNDRVVTSAGMHGVVQSINSEARTVTLRVDENTNAKITVDRETIRIVNKD